MNQIKAIETRYKGYRFRSRLEARWAVFFDRLGLSWEYEPEGFETKAGKYLPDFRVTGVDTNGDEFLFWFEVKPNHQSVINEFEKLGAFAAVSDGPLILLEGVPEVIPYHSLGSTRHINGSDDWTRGFDYVLWSCRKRPWFLCGDWEGGWNEHHTPYHQSSTGSVNRDLHDAVNSARSARFEHGECGAIAR